MPGSLVDLGMGIPMDPWEQPYEFVNIQAVGTEDANLRRDGRLHLLNTDYDLYSRGKDGETAVPLEAESSRDDVVRASNGAFIGLGADY
jgi:general secretion pathway protein G